jgi:peptidoglycan hydrolase CwlO-like protein
MNKKIIVSLCVAAALVAGTIVLAQSADQAKTKADPRIDQLIEQNKKIQKTQDDILKNQETVIKMLEEVKTGLQQLRRRSS